MNICKYTEDLLQPCLLLTTGLYNVAASVTGRYGANGSLARPCIPIAPQAMIQEYVGGDHNVLGLVTVLRGIPKLQHCNVTSVPNTLTLS